MARGRITRLVTGALVIAAVFFRIVIMWLYNGSGRSVLVVALFHSAFNSATSLGEQKFTGELISESALLYAIGALVAIVVVVAVFTRGRLAYEPEPAAPRTAEEGGWQPNRGCASQPSFREEPLSAILPVFGIETRRDGQVAAPLPGRPSRPALHQLSIGQTVAVDVLYRESLAAWGLPRNSPSFQRRMADFYFARAQSWEELVEEHDRWLESYNIYPARCGKLVNQVTSVTR